MTKRRAHYVVSTHWDREWYQSFQDYRFRLVKLLDEVLDALADDRLKGPFYADGQAVMLQDYLEIRGERRDQVEAYLREGKIVAGPWYVMPDEFIVSGESLIRNLAHGCRVIRDMGGEPSQSGFVCDIFGHNSQLPQILRGFGMKGALIWRGTQLSNQALYSWRSPDGTEIPAYRFGLVGYCDYANKVRCAHERDVEQTVEGATEDLRTFLEDEGARMGGGPVLLFDGGDHQHWDEKLYQAVLRLMHDEGCDYQIVHTSPDQWWDEVLAQPGNDLPHLEGELREPAKAPTREDQQYLIPGVLASRVWIKQENAACENLLCRWAEPLSTMTAEYGLDAWPSRYLETAWQWLLRNHPHDSICGCSIDSVHEDMKFRFSQCRGIGERLAQEAMQAVAAHVEGELDDQMIRVAVFNPLPTPLNETIELKLPIPADWPVFSEFFGFEPKPAFRIYDSDGDELPYQRITQQVNQYVTRIRTTKFPDVWRCTTVHVSVPLALPPLGYTTLTVHAGEKGNPTRHPVKPGLATSERGMENDVLRVTIESNGSVTILDKRSDRIYERLLTFEDCADIGDGWYHGMAANDQVVTSTGAHAEVALLTDGPMLCQFRVRTHMRVPERFDFAAMTRTDDWSEIILDSVLSLRPHGDHVDVETMVHNHADDHRLRVLFPTGAKAETYLADSPFDVVERTIPLRGDNHEYRELEVETKPQQTWTAVHDNHAGLAVVATGLLESAVRDLPEKPIALTLLRGTRRTVMTSGEPEGLMHDWRLPFRYRIVPLVGPPDRTRLFNLGTQLAAGHRHVALLAPDVDIHRRNDVQLPGAAGFLQIEGCAVLTSMRRVNGATELRLFNPEEVPGEATLHFGERFKAGAQPTRAQLVDFTSQPVGDAIQIVDGQMLLAFEPKRICTVRVE